MSATRPAQLRGPDLTSGAPPAVLDPEVAAVTTTKLAILRFTYTSGIVIRTVRGIDFAYQTNTRGDTDLDQTLKLSSTNRTLVNRLCRTIVPGELEADSEHAGLSDVTKGQLQTLISRTRGLAYHVHEFRQQYQSRLNPLAQEGVIELASSAATLLATWEPTTLSCAAFINSMSVASAPPLAPKPSVRHGLCVAGNGTVTSKLQELSAEKPETKSNAQEQEGPEQNGPEEDGLEQEKTKPEKTKPERTKPQKEQKAGKSKSGAGSEPAWWSCHSDFLAQGIPGRLSEWLRATPTVQNDVGGVIVSPQGIRHVADPENGVFDSWLGDEVVTYVFGQLVAYAVANDQKILFVPPTTSLLLKAFTSESVATAETEFGIDFDQFRAADLILLPQNVDDVHWRLYVIDRKVRKLCVWDSSLDSKPTEAALQPFLEWATFMNAAYPIEASYERGLLQEDSHSCGPLTCYTAALIILGIPIPRIKVFTRSVTKLRFWILWVLMSGEVTTAIIEELRHTIPTST